RRLLDLPEQPPKGGTTNAHTKLFYKSNYNPILKHKAQPKLNRSAATRARHHAKARSGQGNARQPKIGMIEGVEQFGAELEAFLFGEEEVLQKRKVEVDDTVGADDAAPARAKSEVGRLRKGRRIEPTQQGAFGARQIRIAQNIGSLRARRKSVGRVGLRHYA